MGSELKQFPVLSFVFQFQFFLFKIRWFAVALLTNNKMFVSFTCLGPAFPFPCRLRWGVFWRHHCECNGGPFWQRGLLDILVVTGCRGHAIMSKSFGVCSWLVLEGKPLIPNIPVVSTPININHPSNGSLHQQFIVDLV